MPIGPLPDPTHLGRITVMGGLALVLGSCAGQAGHAIPAALSPAAITERAVPAHHDPPAPSTEAGPADPTASPPEDLLVVSSDLGDLVGDGRYWSFDYPAATFGVAPGGRPDAVTVIVSAGADTWSIHLAAPSGQVLEVGSFDNAERVPSSLTPGLDVQANGRRCSETFGAFTISQVLNDADGRFRALEAAFVQHCEFPDGPALNGTLIYRAPDPGPATAGS